MTRVRRPWLVAAALAGAAIGAALTSYLFATTLHRLHAPTLRQAPRAHHGQRRSGASLRFACDWGDVGLCQAARHPQHGHQALFVAELLRRGAEWTGVPAHAHFYFAHDRFLECAPLRNESEARTPGGQALLRQEALLRRVLAFDATSSTDATEAGNWYDSFCASRREHTQRILAERANAAMAAHDAGNEQPEEAPQRTAAEERAALLRASARRSAWPLLMPLPEEVVINALHHKGMWVQRVRLLAPHLVPHTYVLSECTDMVALCARLALPRGVDACECAENRDAAPLLRRGGGDERHSSAAADDVVFFAKHVMTDREGGVHVVRGVDAMLNYTLELLAKGADRALERRQTIVQEDIATMGAMRLFKHRRHSIRCYPVLALDGVRVSTLLYDECFFMIAPALKPLDRGVSRTDDTSGGYRSNAMTGAITRLNWTEGIAVLADEEGVDRERFRSVLAKRMAQSTDVALRGAAHDVLAAARDKGERYRAAELFGIDYVLLGHVRDSSLRAVVVEVNAFPYMNSDPREYAHRLHFPSMVARLLDILLTESTWAASVCNESAVVSVQRRPSPVHPVWRPVACVSGDELK
mmetsp:Transcript_22691/g.55409  ORF Transcript_22691/g.55409 Transcript_22691/m.55409 type:complete len:586 (+) Transcript_22691:361-2118(+)